jgi:cold shock CspA family protein
MEGIFLGWAVGKSTYGFIQPDDRSGKVFVLRADVEIQLQKGARVSYEVVATDRSPKATNIILLAPPAAQEFGEPAARGRGRVLRWTDKGFGFIAPDDGSAEIYVHASALPEDEDGYLSEGNLVEYAAVEQGEGKSLRATQLKVVGWAPPADERGAFIDALVDMGGPHWPKQLASDAEDERWEYRTAKSHETLPILRSYIRYTHRRLREMEDAVKVSRDGSRAAFNTGLVTDNQEEIFGVLVKHPREGRQPWKLLGFKKTSDQAIVQHFAHDLPPLAHYFDDPSVLLYDRRLPLIINIDHVLENIDRFPAALQSNVTLARVFFQGAQDTMKKRVSRNYKTGIPHYFRDRNGRGSVQLLLPICFTNPAEAELALVVSKNPEGTAYYGSTVLTLDMAYNNARLLSRPDTEWLRP